MFCYCFSFGFVLAMFLGKPTFHALLKGLFY